MSNNLQLEQVAPNQNQKEATINDQAGQLDAAITEILDVDFSGGDVTLTTEEFRRHFEFRCDGQSASRDLNLPDVKRAIFSVVNIDGSFPIVVTKGATTVSVGAGERALFSTDGTTDDLTQIGGNAATTKSYNAGFFFSGLPGAGARVGGHIIAEPGGITIPVNADESQAEAEVASTGSAVFDIQKNGASVGSFTFASSATATFTMASPVTLAQGDRLQIIAPGSQDATLSDVYLTIRGTY